MKPRSLQPVHRNILAYLAEHPQSDSRDIHMATGHRAHKLDSALTTLYVRGLVGRQQSMDWIAVRWYWSATNEGIEALERAKAKVGA